MKRVKLLASACLWSVFMVLGFWISSPLAEGAFVDWNRMEGVIVPGTAFGTFNVVGGATAWRFHGLPQMARPN